MGGPVLLPADGDALVRLAAETVRARLLGDEAEGQLPRSVALRRLGSSFVTLECAGLLRGCIGSLEPVRPLYRDVARNATKAMTDPRLDPVVAEELDCLRIKVAVLGPSERMVVRGLADLRRQVRPHLDGIVITAGRRQATFLPAVWAKLPDPGEFLAALLTKGGWSPERLPPGAVVRRYTTHEFHTD